MPTQLAALLLATATLGTLTEDAIAQPTAILAERGFKCQEPYYPAAALRTGATGRTVLRVKTNEVGQIAEVTVEQASGRAKENKLLDLSAIQHVKSCSAAPPTTRKAETFTYELVWSLPAITK